MIVSTDFGLTPYANNAALPTYFPVPYLIRNFPPEAQLGWWDANYAALQRHVSNVANIALSAYVEANSAANTLVVYNNNVAVMFDGNVDFTNTSSTNARSNLTAPDHTQILIDMNTSSIVYTSPSLGIGTQTPNSNLTVIGNAWITGDSTLTGNTTISANAYITDNLTVTGNAYITHNTTISANAYITENLIVSGNIYTTKNVTSTNISTSNIVTYDILSANVLATNAAFGNVISTNANVGTLNVAALYTTTGVNLLGALSGGSSSANAAANTVATYNNGVLTLSSAAINFNNSSTINVSTVANGTTLTDVSLSVNGNSVLSLANVNTNNANVAILLAGNTTTSNLFVTHITNKAVYNVLTIPSASVVGVGAEAYCNDSITTTFASILAGGGSNVVPVYSNGVNWLVG
jgi:hypothetical protein